MRKLVSLPQVETFDLRKSLTSADPKTTQKLQLENQNSEINFYLNLASFYFDETFTRRVW